MAAAATLASVKERMKMKMNGTKCCKDFPFLENSHQNGKKYRSASIQFLFQSPKILSAASNTLIQSLTISNIVAVSNQ